MERSFGGSVKFGRRAKVFRENESFFLVVFPI
jgi:hypothetical protein